MPLTYVIIKSFAKRTRYSKVYNGCNTFKIDEDMGSGRGEIREGVMIIRCNHGSVYGLINKINIF
jgi:hypothetical protein